MPIVYEQAQPNPAQIASAYGAAQTRLAAAPQIAQAANQSRALAYGAAADANRLAGQLGSQDADRLQAGQIAAARQDLDERQFAASGTPTDRDSFLQQAALAQENQRFQNQAALIGVELTTQERMRLSRMKNAIGDVQNDPSLSDQEKADLTIRLKTGIDPLEHRLAKQKFEMDKMVKEQLVEARQMEAAQREQDMAFAAGSAARRIKIIPTAEASKEAGETVRTLYPNLSPGTPEWEAAVEDAVIAQGPDAYQRVWPDSKGNMVPVDESRHGGVGKGAKGGPDGKGSMSQQDYYKTYSDVLAKVAADQNIPAGEKIKVAKEMMAAMESGWNERQAAAAPKKPEPFDAFNAGSGHPPQRKRADYVRETLRTVTNSPLVHPDVKAAVAADAKQYLELIGKYTAPTGEIVAPPAVRKRIDELRAKINNAEALASAPAPVPPAPVAAPAAPARHHQTPQEALNLNSRLRSGAREFLNSLHPGLGD